MQAPITAITESAVGKTSTQAKCGTRKGSGHRLPHVQGKQARLGERPSYEETPAYEPCPAGISDDRKLQLKGP